MAVISKHWQDFFEYQYDTGDTDNETVDSHATTIRYYLLDGDSHHGDAPFPDNNHSPATPPTLLNHPSQRAPRNNHSPATPPEILNTFPIQTTAHVHNPTHAMPARVCSNAMHLESARAADRGARAQRIGTGTQHRQRCPRTRER